jgi:hypothetical protein
VGRRSVELIAFFDNFLPLSRRAGATAHHAEWWRVIPRRARLRRKVCEPCCQRVRQWHGANLQADCRHRPPGTTPAVAASPGSILLILASY